MNIKGLFDKLPAAQHKRVHVDGGMVYVQLPKNYFGAGVPEKIVVLGTDNEGDLFRITVNDIPDAISTKLTELGIG